MRKLYLFLMLCCGIFQLRAQHVTITPSGIAPASASGFPKLSYEAIQALPSPQKGDIAIDTTFRCIRFYNGTKWAFLLNSPEIQVPTITAWKPGGGTENDLGIAIVTDTVGNIYITGSFYGNATFGSTTLTSAGNNDIYIAKFNSNGILQWINRAGGTSTDSSDGMAVDADGNVYITGYFYSSCTFWSYNHISSVVSLGGTDIFIAKYNSNGSLQWVKRAGGETNDFGREIKIGTDGYVYLTGYFWGTTRFGDYTYLYSFGDYDCYIAKYNYNGGLQWARQIGGTNSDYGWGLALDSDANVYVTGYFQGTARFGTGQGFVDITSAGDTDIFVTKYNSSGLFQWVRQAGGPGTDKGFSIAVQSAATLTPETHVYVTGEFTNTAAFSTTNLTSFGSSDVFIAKYNAEGAVQWAKNMGGSNTDFPRGITVSPTGSVYVTGAFSGGINFGSNIFYSAGGYDIFTAKYDSTGNSQWIQQAGGTGSSDTGFGVTLNPTGHCYTIGYFQNTAAFGTTLLSSSGGYDIFIMKTVE